MPDEAITQAIKHLRSVHSTLGAAVTIIGVHGCRPGRTGRRSLSLRTSSHSRSSGTDPGRVLSPFRSGSPHSITLTPAKAGTRRADMALVLVETCESMRRGQHTRGATLILGRSRRKTACTHENVLSATSVGIERKVCEDCGNVSLRYEITAFASKLDRGYFSRDADRLAALRSGVSRMERIEESINP